MNSSVFDDMESNVRSYCRAFPTVFDRAKDALMWDEDGKKYIDFFAGAGALNYGHNNSYIKSKVLAFLSEDRVLHALDMHTIAKREFLESFGKHVLKPKNLNYKVQFTGPTGTNAVEAAMKIARRVNNSPTIIAFSGAYHGMSLGALAATSSRESRAAAGVPLEHVSFLPYDTEFATIEPSLTALERAISDCHSGVDKPAAVILETVQAEGGINPARSEWLRGVQQICRNYGVLIIVDDIQVGCYRTGAFFSFEDSGITPDIVTLSKSISGIGFPMSLVLVKPEYDIWRPGEHTGTFRGNQVAFVGARAALEHAYERDMPKLVARAGTLVSSYLQSRIAPLHRGVKVRGRGLIWGVDLSAAGGCEMSKRVAATCFERGLIIERTGRMDTVLKILPPLVIEEEVLLEGLAILGQSLTEHLGGLSET